MFNYIRLKKIKISENFKSPKEKLMRQKVLYYINNKKFESEIVLDKNNELVDGYTTYLICKKLEKKFVKFKRA